MTEQLTPTQHRILTAMVNNDLGLAAFTGEHSRQYGFGICDARDGGIIIRVYGTPEYFLKTRGLIERTTRNVPGVWYRVTEKGWNAVQPRKPKHLARRRIRQSTADAD